MVVAAVRIATAVAAREKSAPAVMTRNAAVAVAAVRIATAVAAMVKNAPVAAVVMRIATAAVGKAKSAAVVAVVAMTAIATVIRVRGVWNLPTMWRKRSWFLRQRRRHHWACIRC